MTMTGKPLAVLFLDRTGTTLTPMAVALLRAQGGKRFTTHGAGDGMVHPACLSLLEQKGVDGQKLSLLPLAAWQRPEKSVTVDAVIRLGSAVKNVPPGLYGVPAKADWPMDDPADATSEEQALWKTRKAFEILHARVLDLTAAALPVTRGELQNALNALGKKF